jgi:hypothetical protein
VRNRGGAFDVELSESLSKSLGGHESVTGPDGRREHDGGPEPVRLPCPAHPNPHGRPGVPLRVRRGRVSIE